MTQQTTQKLTRAKHFKWEDYRRTINWDLPLADRFGFHRGAYAPMDSSDLAGRVVRVLPGQASPVHRIDTDTIIVNLLGEVDFTFGDQRFVLGPNDLLSIPANTPYAYANYALTDSIFFKVQPHPAAGTEHVSEYRLNEAEPGWDVPTDLEVTHQRWDDYRRQVVYRGGMVSQFGFHRGVMPHIQASSFKGHPVRVPPGQSSPWHTVANDVIFVGLVGEIEVYAEDQAFSLGPMDVLVLPPPLYGLQNVGLTEAVYFSVNAKPTDPPKMKYFESAVVGDPLAGPGTEFTP